MNLLAPPADERVDVPVSWEVLYYGTNARADRGRGEPLFPHQYVPSPPAKLPDEAEWLVALDFAEEARRYNQAGCAVLDLSKRDGAGSNGPMGRGGPSGPMLMASSRGVEVDGRLATWPQLLGGRREQREIEPQVARARDLAEAYHYLDYYGRVYEGPSPATSGARCCSSSGSRSKRGGSAAIRTCSNPARTTCDAVSKPTTQPTRKEMVPSDGDL
jgi:hypothetical protein